MFLNLFSHQSLLILKAYFTTYCSQRKCVEITAAMFWSNAQGSLQTSNSDKIFWRHKFRAFNFICTNTFYTWLQGGHRLPGFPKPLRLRAPDLGVKENKGTPITLPIQTSGLILATPVGRRVGAQHTYCPSCTAVRHVIRSRSGALHLCFLHPASPEGDLEKAQRRTSTQQSRLEAQGSGETGSTNQHREWLTSDGFVGNRCGWSHPVPCWWHLCICRHFLFASQWNATACQKADLFWHP